MLRSPEPDAVKLTTARYFTPNGRSIHASGIEPDIMVRREDGDTVEGYEQKLLAEALLQLKQA